MVGLMLVGLSLRGFASDSLAIENTHEVGNDGSFDALILAASYLMIAVAALGLLAQVTLPLMGRLVDVVRRRREAEWRDDS